MAKKKKAQKVRVQIQAKKAPRVLRWTTTTQIGTSVSHGQYRLGLAISQENNVSDWTVVALETNAKADLQAVLNSHAHKVVGVYSELFEAMQAATIFAQGWTPGAELCDCEEM